MSLRPSFRYLNRMFGSSTGIVESKCQPLIDSYGRQHDYLRISLTERCNLRCLYCMPSEGVKLTDREKLLSLDELNRIARSFIELCGITKIRLTGGEPTIDSRLMPFLERLDGFRTRGLKTLAMTTNGITLRKHAKTLKDLGKFHGFKESQLYRVQGS